MLFIGKSATKDDISDLGLLTIHEFVMADM